jgi:hypothetical protein
VVIKVVGVAAEAPGAKARAATSDAASATEIFLTLNIFYFLRRRHLKFLFGTFSPSCEDSPTLQSIYIRVAGKEM